MSRARCRRSSVIEAHAVFQKYHRHHSKELTIDEKDEDEYNKIQQASSSTPFPMFHRVEKTGVIYATSRAKSNGFSPQTEDEWAK